MEQRGEFDPWYEALQWWITHHHQSCHQDILLTGLPLENGRLDQQLFFRALERAQLSAASTPLSNLESFALPVMLIDKESQHPWIVIESHEQNYQVWRAGQIQTVPLSEIKRRAEQTVWHVTPIAKYDERVETLQPRKQGHWLWSVVAEVKPWYRDLLLASLLINLLALVVPLFTMNVYDRVVPNQAFSTLWVLVIGVVVVVIFDWLLRSARSAVTDVAGRYLDNKLSAILLSKVLGMKLENRPQSVGAFSRQIQDFDSVRDFFTSISLVTLIDLPFTLLFLILIGWLGGAMMFVPVIVMLVLVGMSLVMKGKIERTQQETAALSSQRQAQLIDCLVSLPEIKQNNAQGSIQKRWEQTVAQLSDWQNRSRYYSNLVAHSIQSSQQIVTICLIVFGVYQISEGVLSMGGLIAIVMLSGRAAGSINQLSLLMLRYQQTKTAIEGLNAIIDLPQEDQERNKLSQGEFKGGVRLENVSYQYPQSPTACLTEINLSIRSGERVGVVGVAGAGKSTLLSLIARQANPAQGRLFYDEIDSQLWPTSSIRHAVGWVAQSPQLLYGTVVENITLGELNVDQQRLSDAIRLSGLAGYLDRFSQGLETQVGEGGRFLSGGQRQAVALARALYRDFSLLILDEPTASLDTEAEMRLFHSLQSLPRDKSIIISSHRHSFLSLCDRILVIHQGKIVADGTPDEVLNKKKEPSKRRVRSVSVVKGGKNE
ncbi:peptidase C39 [Vibrio galatheae]|uniref:Peptidase C39 n=1 Tax=Vibrio galatheae TaxID=579748 RepID=A0A0F4NIN0_9VIBR|nr:type I secretion system permease/ATPase [Vibrio galatheae]KJY82980.1 peptidase C39 [Vibrio galatheae]